MRSAFFRRPSDDSSSDSDDAALVEVDLPTEYTEDSIVEGQTATTESLPSHESVSLGDEVDDRATVIPNVERHRANLFSALLEDYARTRATEYLNEVNPGLSLDRSSPQVRSLADSVYRQVSQTLAHNGILPAVSEGDDNKQTRGAYLAGLESLAFASSHDHELPYGQSRQQHPACEQLLAVTKVNKQQQGAVSGALQQSAASLPFRHAQTRLTSQYPAVTFSAPEVRRSHYESSFQQLRLLGKGGFGRVYHAYNIFDQKDYAVKKIPLSPRLSQRYRESGHKELENNLREVQALAQLEHSNVVRYHATWIEEPRMMPDASSPQQHREQCITVQGRKLIADDERRAPPGPIRARSAIPDHSDGIVFGADSESTTQIRDIEEGVPGPTWSPNKSDPEPSSARASEIFTDGNARPSISEDSVADDTVHILHVQMSVYPLTLAQYLAPVSMSSKSSSSTPARRHCFHLAPALRILLGILCGLQYIHARGLIHRGIKPSNIFISTLDLAARGLVPYGYHDVGSCRACATTNPYFVNPRIGDFGLVAQLAMQPDTDTSTSAKKVAKLVGTEYYRPPRWTESPELDSHESTVDEKVDVFALGVILVELLWPCATSTERFHVLRDVQKGKLPTTLGEKIEQEGHDAETAESVLQCISGMIERQPRRRWGCTKVKNRVEMLLQRCETSVTAGAKYGYDSAFDLDEISSVESTDDTSEGKLSLIA